MAVAVAQFESASPDVDDSRRAKVEQALATLVENEDLDRLVSLARLLGSAQDALSDDVVSRLAGITTDGLDLLDRVNRSGVARALPSIAALVENGDLDRVCALARMLGSAQDALSDDVVARLAGIATDGLDLLDRVNRSGVARALPGLSALIENGDFDRIVALSRLLGSAQDALSDDIVARLAGMGADALSLLDRATRTGLADRLLVLADHADKANLVPDLVGAIEKASKSSAPAPQGGIRGLWTMMKQREVQEAIQFALNILREFRRSRVKAG